MAKQLFANNASALLAASISDSDLTIQVAAGYGALYPNPGADEYFIVALENADGDIEFVKVTSRSTDLFTVPPGGRGQDGTNALAWVNGQTRVEVRTHKGALDLFIQRGGDSMSGNLDMDNNNVIDARLTGDWRGTNGQLVGTKLRGTLDDDSNEIAVPSDGSRATAGGEKILVETDEDLVSAAAFEVGMIMLWFGAAINVPTGWAICDGTNSTPDMRGRFPLGVDGTHALNSAAGTFSGSTDAQGAHTHTGTVGGHALTVNELPPHSHATQIYAGTNSSGSHIVASVDGNSSGNLTGETGGGAEHEHDLSGMSTEPDHIHSVDFIPPYRALYYIMYTG